MNGFVIFTDLEKYSQLEDEDLNLYYDRVVPLIYDKLKSYKASSLIWNTWGDAIVAAFSDGLTAINFALDYRDILKNYDFEEMGVKRLNPRIAGHFGKFEVLFDRVSGKINMHGSNVNLAARIEPVTIPGEVFVSKDFKDKILVSPSSELNKIRFDDMGVIELPKKFGQIPVYRLCRSTDEPIPAIGKIISKENTIFSEDIKSKTAKKRSGFKK